MLARWIVWYNDRSSFSWQDGEPWEAPRRGVICITQAADDVGRYIIYETNFYCWHFEEQQWVPHDTLGMHDYLAMPGMAKIVLRGYWVSKEQFDFIRRHALEVDERLPLMSAARPVRPKEE